MKYSFLLACIFFMVATINAQENKIQTPPIKTTGNAKPQAANAVQALPIKTTDNAKQQATSAVQAVPIKSTDAVQKSNAVQAAQSVPIKNADDVKTGQSINTISTVQTKTSATEKSKLPSSVSIKHAQEQLQKKGGDTTSISH